MSSNWPRKSRQARGLGAAWDKLRPRILERDGHLCQCDQCKGGELRVRVADQVHHIVGRQTAKRRGWTQEQIDHPSNLMSVNAECHKRLDFEEQGRKLPRRVGLDGYPLPEAPPGGHKPARHHSRRTGRPAVFLHDQNCHGG